MVRDIQYEADVLYLLLTLSLSHSLRQKERERVNLVTNCCDNKVQVLNLMFPVILLCSNPSVSLDVWVDKYDSLWDTKWIMYEVNKHKLLCGGRASE